MSHRRFPRTRTFASRLRWSPFLVPCLFLTVSGQMNVSPTRVDVSPRDGVYSPRKNGLDSVFFKTGAIPFHPDDRAWDCSFADPGFDDVVIHALAKSRERLYAGGDFTRIGTVGCGGIAMRERGSWSPLGDGLKGTVSAIAVDGDDVFAAGTFYMVGNTIARGIARWDGSAWSPLGAGKPGVDGTVLALAVAGDSVFVGGFIGEAGGSPVSGIAVWNRKDGTWGTLDGGVANIRAAAVVT
ncbi:MAG: hypothetical protein QHI48_05745, partial [Bacteroidota bacterium]|nr:hypothetical protein [Bacteroidota bacterium]